jgi:aspartate racemase
MRKIGLIGGISWVSTADYYRYINTGVNEKLGGLNFAECIIYSFNYNDIKNNNDANDWAKTLTMLTQAALHLENAGAEAILLCANTMHLIADEVQEKLKIPLINIATETAKEIKKQGVSSVGLIGTRFTMEKDFFISKLNKHGINCLIPEKDERDFIHYTIFEELGKGIILPETKKRYIEIINSLRSKGCEGVILGCTEIPLIVSQEDAGIKVFDTALIHSKAAVDFILQG